MSNPLAEGIRMVEAARRIANYESHKARRCSDSSLYDEVCDDCGARDYTGADGLTEAPCPGRQMPFGCKL